jgi:hypothetical protein
VYVELERGMTEFDIVVLEHNMLPRDVLGTDFFERSEELIANVHLGSDRAIQRTTLRVSVQ